MDKMKLDLNAPHQKYFHADGKQVVGVTSYLGVLGKDALMPWAAKMEREGVREHVVRAASKLEDSLALDHNAFDSGDIEAFFATLPKPYFYAGHTSKAADLGTIAHAHIEAWLTGRELDPEGLDPALYEQALDPLKRFTDWWESEGMTLVVSEQQLVHEQYRYGGTIDFVARDRDGNVVLGDIKTTKANKSWPYDTVIAQVAAYEQLWNARVEAPNGPVERVVVVRVGKEASDPGQRVWLDSRKREAGWALFRAAQAAYEAKRLLS